MATQNRSRTQKKQPVTKHPLFPAVVALWFGALFGLGSLAVRVSLLEQLVLALHLDLIITAAAPPLGLKARMLVAIGMTVIGIALGAVIAKQINRPKAVRRERKRGIAAIFGRREPRTGHFPGDNQALSDEPSAPQYPPRRRALAMDENASDDFFDAAPLPGGAPQILDVTQIDLSGPSARDHAEPAPLDLAGYAQPEAASQPDEPEHAHAAPSAAARQVFGQPETAPDLSDAPAMEPVAEAATPAPGARRFDAPGDMPQSLEVTHEVAHVGPVAEPAAVIPAPAQPATPASAPAPLPAGSAAARIAGAELGALSSLELMERLGMALRNRQQPGALPTQLAAAIAALGGSAPESAALTSPPVAPVAPVAADETPPPAPAVSDLPRFASPTGQTLFGAPLHVPDDTIAPEPVAVAQPRLSGSASTAAPASAKPPVEPLAPAPFRLELPAALRPIDFREYEDADDHHDIGLPPRGLSAPLTATPAPLAAPAPEETPVAADTTADVPETDEEVREEAYSSLLDLARPASLRQSFVRIDEPEAETAEIEPVVIFPGQQARAGTRFAAPAPVDVEAAAEEAVPAVAPIADDGGPKLRRFDAPAAVAPAAAAAIPAPDPEETERALRSALATLQRMSGAA